MSAGVELFIWIVAGLLALALALLTVDIKNTFGKRE